MTGNEAIETVVEVSTAPAVSTDDGAAAGESATDSVGDDETTETVPLDGPEDTKALAPNPPNKSTGRAATPV